MIRGHSRKKIIIRSSFIFVLVLSIFLSSFSISYASTVGSLTTPDALIEATPQGSSQNNAGINRTIEILSLLDSGYNVALMIADDFGNNFKQLNTIVSKGNLLYIPSGNNMSLLAGVYSSVSGDIAKSVSYTTYSSFNINTSTFGTISYDLGDFGDGWYRCTDEPLISAINRPNGVFYCSSFFGNGQTDFYVRENLDISAYLPQPVYIFDAEYNDQLDNIRCEVNFNPRVYSSFVTIWGYNELGAILYIYGSDEYNVWFGDEQDVEPETYIFYLDTAAISSAYIGTDFHISSISCMGWEDAHEEYLSVNWDFSSEKEPGEYNPPDNNYYYTTYYNEDYHYAEQNGNVVAFGNVDICLYSDQTLDRVFWDKQETLITPYKYSYVFIPNTVASTTVGDRYYRMIDELVLEFDIVINNCPVAVFDAMYGQGASNEFAALTNLQDMILWFTTHFRYYDLIPYEYYNNLPEENYTSYDCTCFYTDSFYFKSLAYLLGDSNERLLEFESRLLGEDGAWQALLSALKSIYDTNFEYQTDMLTYMSKLNYLTDLIIKRDYFEQYLFHLDSIDDKLSDIKNALVGTNEEDFDNDLHAPWLEIYRYFKNLFNRSLIKLPDFLDTTKEILDGGSNQVGIGFTLDNDYEQALPLNSPSISPTPIPIPTLFP